MQLFFLTEHQPQYKHDDLRSDYGDILLRIADFRIARQEIRRGGRNINKQGYGQPGRFLEFLHQSKSFSLFVFPYDEPHQRDHDTGYPYTVGHRMRQAETLGRYADIGRTNAGHEEGRYQRQEILLLRAHQIYRDSP